MSGDQSSDIFTLRENVGWLIVVNRPSFDNAQSHVTAFRPISEAARSWSDDNWTCHWSQLMCNFNTSYRPVVVLYSYLFWSDGAGINAKIERSDLSGNSRTVLVSSTQGLVSPTTLVVDFSSQKLYWLDSAAEKIGHVNFDGSEPFTLTLSLLSQVSAMTVYRVRTSWIALNLNFGGLSRTNCSA